MGCCSQRQPQQDQDVLLKRISIWFSSHFPSDLVFFLKGRFIFGPDARSLFVTMFLIIAPVIVFCVFVAKELTNSFSYGLGLPVMDVAVVFMAYVGICGAHSGRLDPDGDGSPWPGHGVDAVDPPPPRAATVLASVHYSRDRTAAVLPASLAFAIARSRLWAASCVAALQRGARHRDGPSWPLSRWGPPGCRRPDVNTAADVVIVLVAAPHDTIEHPYEKHGC